MRVRRPTADLNGMLREGNRAARPWIRGLARAGFVAKGIQYAAIGVLAALAAVGSRDGGTTDGKGALEKIGHQPFGQLLLILMAIGLAGYALWRFVEALLDPEHAATGTAGLFKRVGRFGNGIVHGLLVVYVINLLSGHAERGVPGRHDGEAARSWSAQLMAWPGGVWVVGGIGVGLIVFAVSELVRAWRSKLDEQLDLSPLPRSARASVIFVSRFGLAARAVVFAVVGAFLVKAALRAEPGRAKGVGEALHAMQGWTFGRLLLMVIAVGLVAYGAYEMIEARYRRIRAA